MPNVRPYRPVVTGPALTDHVAAADPHPNYALESDVTTSLSGKANTSHTHAQSDITNLTSDLSGKQATLVSGTNIKTVNGSSLLGSGDLVARSFAMAVGASSLAAPGDGSTYLFGGAYAMAPQSSSGTGRVYVPVACTITAAVIYASAGTAGTAENWSLYIRKNDTTDTLIETVSTSSTTRKWSNTGLSITMADGDYFEIKVMCPTWATNAATVRFNGHVYAVVT